MAQTNLNADQISNDDFTSVAIPSGTTAERPSTAVVGMIRYNTTEGALEGYDGAWKKFDLSSGSQTASNSIPTDDSTQTKAKLNLVSEFFGTGAYQLPSGTTAQRPSPSTNGMIRYNTTTNKFEGYKNGQWLFFNLSLFGYDIEYLCVAGGGAGGPSTSSNGGGGGGGAGGLLTGTTQIKGGSVLTITVGSGATEVNNTSSRAASGTDSTIASDDPDFTTITAIGGGGGGTGANNATNAVGADGGSGGGGGYRGYTNQSNGGSGTSGQGNDGSGVQSGSASGGGGGGAGTAGGLNSGSSVGVGGPGGTGLSISITGQPQVYATGGQGGSQSQGHPSANTGNGGGGGYSTSGAKRGASGIVILKIPTSTYSGTHVGNPTITTSGTFTILRYTGSGSYTA